LRASRQPFHKKNSGSGKYDFAGPVFFLRSQFMRAARVLLSIVAAVATAQGAAAQKWLRLGPPGGTVLSLAASGSEVYLGTADGHVFVSNDRGDHWELRGRAGGRLDSVVQRLVADASDNKRVLAAVWFRGLAGGGVFESVDGARHWQATSLQGEVVRALEQSPSQPNLWVAGTRNGVFRSEDDAHSWIRITPPQDLELHDIDSLAVDPRDPQIIYVGTYHLPWKTIDGGKTWNSIAAGMIDDSDIMSLRIDAQNPQRVFSSACSGIYRSEDGGANWVKLQGIPYSSRRTQQLAQDPGDARTLYAATTAGLWMTVDSGETWSRVTGRETDANAVVILRAGQSSRVLAGFDALGVLRSDNRGSTFVDSNDGFAHQVVRSAAVNSVDTQEWMLLVEGSGGRILRTSDRGRSWSEASLSLAGKTAERIFYVAGGWWVALAQGGLAHLDAKKDAWREVRFRDRLPPPTFAPQKSQPTAGARRWRFAAPHVRAFVETGGRLVAGTDDGLWDGNPTSGEFQRSVAKNLPRETTFLALAADGSLLALGEGAIFSGNAQSALWKRLAAPANGESLLWVVDTELDGAAVRLLGTSLGVYVSDGGSSWRLLTHGLPAVGSDPAACSASHCVMAMNNGGLYASTAGLGAWDRLPPEMGPVWAMSAGENDEFLLVTQSEGLMEVRLKKE